MSPIKYLNGVLTIIAILLAVLALRSGRNAGTSDLVGTAYAQAPNTAQEIAFAPWINPRKFVFWDQKSSTVYLYNGDGKLDETWTLGRLGDPLTKR